MAQAGYTVYAGVRHLEMLDSLWTSSCHPLHLDVMVEATMANAVDIIARKHGVVDVLVNNAGYGLNGPVEILDLVDVRREFETNVFGLVRLLQLVLPGMRAQRWGRIINVGSVGGNFTAPGAGAYHASKYAVQSFSDALKMETRAVGVDVVLIKPTGVQTPFAATLERNAPLPPQDSPYHAFAKYSAQATRGMFGKHPRLAGIIPPTAVARVIHVAIDAGRPKTRYVVGLSGYVYLALRRGLPDRA